MCRLRPRLRRVPPWTYRIPLDVEQLQLLVDLLDEHVHRLLLRPQGLVDVIESLPRAIAFLVLRDARPVAPAVAVDVVDEICISIIVQVAFARVAVPGCVRLLPDRRIAFVV